MIGIIDYGVGNLFSLESSLKAIGQETRISGDPDVLADADELILPGVGAFADASQKLRKSGLDRFVQKQAMEGKPLLGICLGMQLLFQRSYEYGLHEGLGLLHGEVVPMKGKIPEQLKIPHIGWNRLEFMKRDSCLLTGISEGDSVYFVHSYCAVECASSLVAVTEYGFPVTAMVEQKNICGCQFHPEKSGKVGLTILQNFCQRKGVGV